MSGAAKIFANGTWAVTPYGIEELGAFGYWLNAEAMGGLVWKEEVFYEWGFMSRHVSRNFMDKDLLFWPIHYALKRTVNIDDFMEVYVVGLGVHAGRYQAFSTDVIKNTLDFIEKVARPETGLREGLRWAKAPRVVIDMEKHLREM
ncbi:hypothetical protein FBZ84_103479 [Azospirillum baldaniorum]|uniref:hypothetical protein n=1 Tax=Azospirillum baldaniorum TaxID=1064539 RepID=UPI0011A29905|nr:hypothetical protein [Azospirillum baldaniorum]TWA69760.1 hypothetical protein FBZ84_103479 [Azospirillum baldaniorum]